MQFARSGEVPTLGGRVVQSSALGASDAQKHSRIAAVPAGTEGFRVWANIVPQVPEFIGNGMREGTGGDVPAKFVFFGFRAGDCSVYGSSLRCGDLDSNFTSEIWSFRESEFHLDAADNFTDCGPSVGHLSERL